MATARQWIFSEPQPSFFFGVTIAGCRGESSFQEVSGLKAKWKTKPLAEGGQNRFVHQLPERTEYEHLILKRGVVAPASTLASWLTECFRAELGRAPYRKRDIVVQLFNARADPVLKWSIHAAFPVSWDHSPLDSMDGKLLVETIELSYAFFERAAV